MLFFDRKGASGGFTQEKHTHTQNRPTAMKFSPERYAKKVEGREERKSGFCQDDKYAII